jgi:hypothetical protein
MLLAELIFYSNIMADGCSSDPAIILSMLHCVFCDMSKMFLSTCCSIFVVSIMNDSLLDVLDLLRSRAAGSRFGTSVSAC